MARVLIVEDDGALRYDLSSELSSWGHEVLVATDGSSGFLSIRDEYPDLVLCDIVMPKASGFDLLERLKLLGSDYEDICFLFISSRDGPEMIVEGIKVGADDYITKPIDFRLLKVKVESHTKKRRDLLNRVEALSISASTWNGFTFAAVFAVSAMGLGVAAFVIVYWFKSLLGINIFEDFHLSDLLP